MLRDPTLRAYSHWKMEHARRLETLDFATAVSSTGRKRVEQAPGGVHRIFSYVERGFYARQIANLLNVFPRHHVHFMTSARLMHDPDGELRSLLEFLGHEGAYRSLPQLRVTPVGTSNYPATDPEVRAKLDSLFAPEVDAVEALTGLSLREPEPDAPDPTLWTPTSDGRPRQSGN